MTILDTPEQIEMFHLMQLKYMLRIEVNTGMRHSRVSILRVVNDTLIRKGRIQKPYRRKKDAYDAMVKYIEDRQKELFPDAEE